MPSRNEAFQALQSKMRSEAEPWREAHKRLVERDTAIVCEVRDYLSDVIRLLLPAIGEAITLDMSNRFLDLINLTTRLHVVLRQEDFRFFRFSNLEMSILFDAGSVYVNSRPPMGREGRYFYDEINELVVSHFSPARAAAVYAGDFGIVRKS